MAGDSTGSVLQAATTVPRTYLTHDEALQEGGVSFAFLAPFTTGSCLNLHRVTHLTCWLSGQVAARSERGERGPGAARGCCCRYGPALGPWMPGLGATGSRGRPRSELHIPGWGWTPPACTAWWPLSDSVSSSVKWDKTPAAGPPIHPICLMT